MPARRRILWGEGQVLLVLGRGRDCNMATPAVRLGGHQSSHVTARRALIVRLEFHVRPLAGFEWPAVTVASRRGM